MANLCGGCGAIPPEGCQAWSIDLTQTADTQTLNPNRVVGLQGTVTTYAERDIPGAHCVFQRADAPAPDAHLGIVTLTTPRITLTQVPTYDALQASIRYDNNPALGPTQLFGDGETVDIAAGGGRQIGPFTAQLPAPEAVTGTSADEFQAAIDVLRGTSVVPTQLHWQPAQDPATGGAMRFFAGGSRQAFNRNVYRGIEHYQLQATLDDDGTLEIGPELSPIHLPDSAIWVYLRRENNQRVVIGPHAVDLSAASRAEGRASAGAAAAEAPPFDILEPSPDERRIDGGQPLTIRWSAPPADGPLTVALTTFDATSLASTYVGCQVDDPSTGSLTLPPEATADWPTGAADDRQLTIRQDLVTVPLPGRDRGALTVSYSLILTLDP